jgi:hypothetical protein
LGLTGIQDDQFPTVTFNQGYAQLGDSTHYRNTLVSKTAFTLSDSASHELATGILLFCEFAVRWALLST